MYNSRNVESFLKKKNLDVRFSEYLREMFSFRVHRHREGLFRYTSEWHSSTRSPLKLASHNIALLTLKISGMKSYFGTRHKYTEPYFSGNCGNPWRPVVWDKRGIKQTIKAQLHRFSTEM